MTPSVVHVYGSAHIHRNDKKSHKPLIPVFETIDEARKSLILEKGKHEYRIIESPVSIDLFDVCWVSNNELYQYTYKKKITGYEGIPV